MHALVSQGLEACELHCPGTSAHGIPNAILSMAHLQDLEGGRKAEFIPSLWQPWADAWAFIHVSYLLWPLGVFLQSIRLNPGGSYKHLVNFLVSCSFLRNNSFHHECVPSQPFQRFYEYLPSWNSYNGFCFPNSIIRCNSWHTVGTQ